MATAQMDTVIQHLRRAVLRHDGAGRTDGQLLSSFLDQKDDAAFEALVRRHGPMVLGVCRRIVGNHHDAEDAFQATFLVLARKAPSVKPRERVANWLHGVALRTAMKARTMTAKRRGREKQVTELPEPEAAPQDQWRDLQPLIDQELNGLPENYRLPILLCDLEGKTIKEATQQLGWPQGTLASRLARGRKLLASRLVNRGVLLSAGALAAVVAQNAASAGVPASLMSSTVKTATMIAVGQATVAGVVPAKVAALMEGVMKAMVLSKLKAVTAVLLALGVMTLGGGLLTSHLAMAQPTDGNKPGTTTPIPQTAPPNGDPIDKAFRGAGQEGRLFLVPFVDSVFLVPFVDSGTVSPKQAPPKTELAAPMLGPVPIALDFGFPVVSTKEGIAPPPKVADQREYVIVSRLLEAGADQPKEVLRLPKATVDDGQLVPLHITDTPQNLLAKVVVDEKIKIGTFLDLRVNRLEGNKIRLRLSFQKNEIEKSNTSEIRVLGNNVQVIQDVELHKPVKIVFQKDAKGSAQRWVEITVDEQTIPDPKK